MGRERTLLERIAVLDDSSGRRVQLTASEDLNALMESVRTHLGRLLNSRHGMSEAQPDYGLPALTDLTIGSRDYVREVEEAIRIAVEKYEPRLRRVRVSRVVDEDQDENAPKSRTLAFRIDAVLIAQSGEHRVWYQTNVKRGSGEFEVLD